MRDPSGKVPVLIPLAIGAGILILTSPSYVNAPGPGDPTYDSRSPLLANAAMGAVGGYVFRIVGGAIFGAISSRFCSKAGQLADEEINLFRGVNQSNHAYDDALNGVAKPNGGTANPLEHNTGSTLNSPYTSWTTNPAVAENFALRPGGTPGVVLEINVPLSKTIASPNLKEIVLIQNGKVVSESEVLISDIIRGAKVTKVKRR